MIWVLEDRAVFEPAWCSRHFSQVLWAQCLISGQLTGLSKNL
ncbi:hypothetical protein C1O63_1023 [Dehalococcoides mccartyi]|nr:hypothetical protein C1O63_1023 [Dehalococcoides mccartyi]